MKKINTSWGKNAAWYDETISKENSFQQKVILPNLLRLMDIQKGETIVDVGAGTGFFSRAFAGAGAKVVGVDAGEELIEIARNTSDDVEYLVSKAESMPLLKNGSADKVTCILALQNMAKAEEALQEMSRILKKGGKMFLVLNHPVLRIPGESSSEYDVANVQYRRLNSYMSQKRVKIQMHPGADPGNVSWSFHAPLQFYFKNFEKCGLAVLRLEEWISHKKTAGGPRAEAENRARSEFPLFLALVLTKF